MSDAGIVIPVRIEGEGESVLTLEALAQKMREVGAAAESTKDKIKGHGDALTNLKEHVVGIVAGYLSLHAALHFVTESLKAQAANEAAINKLNLALANQGRLTAETSKELIEYAKGLQETTTFSKEAVIAGEGILASFNLNEEQIKRTTSAATDFAAATGKDLESAIRLLGKASVGSTGALGKLGFKFTEGATASQKFEQALEQVEKRFGGAAAAQTQTFTGAMAQLKNQFEEAHEGFGRFLAVLIGGNEGFKSVIDFVKKLAHFLGTDLIIALSEARALFAEFVASVADKLAGLFDLLAKLPASLGGDTFKGIGDTLRAVAQGQRDLATETRAAGDAASVSEGNLAKFTNGVATAGNESALTAKEIEALAKATEKATDTITKAQETIGKGLAEELERNLPAVDAAFAKIARETEKAAKDVQDAVNKAFDKLPGGVPPEIQAQVDALAEGWSKVKEAQEAAALDEARVRAFGEGVKEADLALLDLAKTFELLKGADPFTGQSTEAVAEWAQKVAEEATKGSEAAAAKIGPAFTQALTHLIPPDVGKLSLGALQKLEEQLVGIEKQLRGVPALAVQWDSVATALGNVRTAERDVYNEGLQTPKPVEKMKIETVKLTDALSLAADAAQLLGKTSFSAFIGGILSAAAAGQQVATALKGANAQLEKAQQTGDEATIKAAKRQQTLARAQAGAAGAQTAFSIFQQNKTELSGAKAAASGAAAGAAFGSQFGFIGAAVGGIAGGLIGFFSGSKFRKIAKDAGKVLGDGLSKETISKIQEDSKKLGISTKNAALLNISTAIEDTGKAAGTFAPQVGDLLKAIASGAVPAREGLAQVGQVFGQIADEALKAGKVGDRALVGIIKQARALGTDSPEIKAFVASQLEAATAGVGKFIDSLSSLSGETVAKLGADAGVIFGANFAALVSEKGVVAAVDAMGESFGKLKETLTKSLGGDAAAQILSPFEAAFATIGNEALRPIFEGIDGVTQAMKGLANAGFLTTDQFSAMQRVTGTLFDEAIAGGADMKTALQAVAPSIQAAISAAEEFGVPLDARTQDLKALAEQNGITFKTDPQRQMLDVLVSIADVLGAKLPESVKRSQEALTGLADTTSQQFNSAGEASKAAFKSSLEASKEVGKGFVSSIGPAFKAAEQAGDAWVAASAAQQEAFVSNMTTTVPEAILTTASAFDSLGQTGDTTWATLEDGAAALSSTLAGDVPDAAQVALEALAQLQSAAAQGISVNANVTGGVPEVPGGPGGAPGTPGGTPAVQNQNTINLTVQQNPFQTAEGQEATRKLILATVDEAVANLEVRLGD